MYASSVIVCQLSASSWQTMADSSDVCQPVSRWLIDIYVENWQPTVCLVCAYHPYWTICYLAAGGLFANRCGDASVRANTCFYGNKFLYLWKKRRLCSGLALHIFYFANESCLRMLFSFFCWHFPIILYLWCDKHQLKNKRKQKQR